LLIVPSHSTDESVQRIYFSWLVVLVQSLPSKRLICKVFMEDLARLRISVLLTFSFQYRGIRARHRTGVTARHVVV
jgi:hypothetical protein